MGIKGIYREIGPGERISLCKLAVENLEQTGRPLRLAIDISIWQFQVQAARGGANPAIRTLFYRLVRLLGLSVQPIFVFDGPNKPVFKRNKRSGRGDGVATAMAKRLIRLFGFAVHDAPGEAEAECALLQRHGVVDAVLSEDVDTIMFGCTRTLRNWSAEGPRSSKTPTHVSLYDAEELSCGESGLDREGMVLVALMSGGDYLPEGVPGCGVKVACEAAKAGFGKSLCRIKKANVQDLAVWKESLAYELRTNESGFFRTRHKALSIPDSFPNLEVLRYYTHPVVSQQATIDRLRAEFPSTSPVDVVGLREFVRETFDWTNKIGAVKFIRVLSPSLLVQKLLTRNGDRELESDAVEEIRTRESTLVKSISACRRHSSTDMTPELRISYIPADIAGLDIDAEPEEIAASYGRNGLALNSDDEFEDVVDEEVEAGQPKNGIRKPFDPLQPDLVWVSESVAKLTVPLTVEDWEEQQRSKELARTTKSTRSRGRKAPAMPAGALDRWVKVTKSIPALPESNPLIGSAGLGSELQQKQTQLPSLVLLSSSSQYCQTSASLAMEASAPKIPGRVTRSKQQPKPKDPSLAAPASASQPMPQTKNPWTLAGSQTSPRVTKSSKPPPTEAVVISSSPPGPASPPPHTPMTRRVQTPPLMTSNHPSVTQPSPRSSRKQLPLRADSKNLACQTGAEPKLSQQTPRRLSCTKSGASATSRDLTQKSLASVGFVRENGTREGSTPKNIRPPGSIAISDDDDSEHNEEGTALLPLSAADDPFGLADIPLVVEKSPDLASTGITAEGGPRKPTTRLFIPRTSNVGYYKEVEVTREVADQIASGGVASNLPGGIRIPKGAAIFRRSDVSILDLTGDDEKRVGDTCD